MSSRTPAVAALGALFAAIALVLASGQAGAQNRPGTTPQSQGAAQQVPSVCTLTQADLQFDGDQQLYFGNFAFILPDGRYVVAMRADLVEICYLADNSILIVDPATGRETSREANSATASAAFDRIISTARTTGRCLVDCGGAIAPPDTGDAGLARW